ncbi:MAG: hypothetical protein IJ194_05860 [Bacilli bacterium]|nr:hypothetical protein [Bacilli bacterium]
MIKIKSISFWKRDPNSVENIQRLQIKVQPKECLLTIENRGKKEESTLPIEEYKKILSYLFDDLHIEETEEKYKAFQYEDNINDFNLKFFLEIDYSNFTYLAIKGIHPFKQGNYQEIMKFFTKWIQP